MFVFYVQHFKTFFHVDGLIFLNLLCRLFYDVKIVLVLSSPNFKTFVSFSCLIPLAGILSTIQISLIVDFFLFFFLGRHLKFFVSAVTEIGFLYEKHSFVFSVSWDFLFLHS